MRSAVVAFLVVASVSIGACSRRHGTSARDVDQATMAVIDTARALHHEADVYETAGDFVSARLAIERVLALRIPAAVREADDIRLDAWGRLGEIALEAGDPDRALSQANTGIQAGHGESVLRARLYVVKGRALRALADRANAAGDTATTVARRREAIEALETSIRMDQDVLGRVLDGGDGE